MSTEAANDDHQVLASAITLRVALSSSQKYELEKIRIAMGAASHEDAIRRAYMEFVTACGLTFGSSDDIAKLQAAGVLAPEGTRDVRQKPGSYLVLIPSPQQEGFAAILKRRTRSKKFSDITVKALLRAHQRYVSEPDRVAWAW